MAENPIKYSDLIEADDSIQKAIKELTELKAIYEEMIKTIQAHASDVKKSMKDASGATEEGRKTTKKAASETKILERAYKQLTFAMSENGAKLAQVRAAIAQTNADSRAQIQMTRAAEQSYLDLKAKLELAVGTYKKLSREEALNTSEGQQLLETILQLKTQLREYDQAMKLNVKTQKEATNATRAEKTELTALERAKRKLSQATSEQTTELFKLQREEKEALRIAKLKEQVMASQVNSYNHLSAQYELNKIELNKMSLEMRQTNETAKAFEQETHQIYTKMIRLQEATGKHTLSVGKYRDAWNGLNNGVSQVVRELPALGISMNTFFLAISNNIPILIDEIGSLNKINKQLIQDGKETISIWGQIGKSLFSFNVVMMLVLTVLSMFGKDIIDWVGKLFKAKDATDNLSLSQKALVAVLAESDGQVKSQTEAVIELGIQIRKYGNDATYTKGIIESFNKIFKTHYTTIEEVRKAYPRLARAQIEAAIKMAASQKLIADAAQQMLRREQAQQLLAGFSQEQVKEAETNLRQFFAWRKSFLINAGSTEAEAIASNNKLFAKIGQEGFKQNQLFMTKQTEAFSTYLQKGVTAGMKDSMQNWFQSVSGSLVRGVVSTMGSDVALDSMIDAAEKLYEGKLSDVFPDDKDPKEKKGPKARTEEIMRANNEIIAAYEESRTALLRDEYAKRSKELTDTLDAESAELRNKYANDADLTEESRAKILEIIKNKTEETNYQLGELDKQRQIDELKLQEETLALRIEATVQGTIEEFDAKMLLFQKQRERELAENAKLAEDLRQSEADINAKWDQRTNDERLAFNESYYLGIFKQGQENKEAEFNSVKRTEQEKQLYRLQLDREYWVKRLEMAKAGLIASTDIELAGMQAFIDAIDQQTADLKDKNFDIYSMVGLKLSDEEKDAIKQTTDFVIGQMKNILAAELEIANQAVAAADKRAEAAKRAVDSEIQARENGYAYNLTAANRELEIARKQQREALRLQEEATKRQQALETIEQTASLITASANIWKVFSKINPLLAIGAIGLMFGSFAAAKIKAAQATKATAQAKLYAEGGVEFLDGGSHASGNDIPLGRMKDGRQRRAEGGEALAIIRKTQAGKYRKLLPDIIGSLNKGTFERKYMAALVGNAVVNVTSHQTDTKQMESELRAIREQGERRFAVSPDGKMIEQYKNLKTIYK